MRILGLNVYHGDAAAAVIRDGRLLCAVAEERFSREKHEGGFPERAIRWCVRELGGLPDVVAVGRNPSVHRWRKIMALVRSPRIFRRVPERLENARALRELPRSLANLLGRKSIPVAYIEHHRAHLAHAYFTAPFEHCALLSLDGFGDFVSTAWGLGRGGNIEIQKRVFFPHSLGLFYTAITQFLGFTEYGEEYKVMALAAYGAPRYRDVLRQLIAPTRRGFRLTPAYFEHAGRGVSMTFGKGRPVLGQVFHPRLETLLGPPRHRSEPLTERHADIAASLQTVTEEIILHIARHVREETGEKTIALAGGVALNSVGNGVLLESGIFQDVWIPSAPADDGTAVGAAAAVALAHGEGIPPQQQNSVPFLGPAATDDELHSVIRAAGIDGREEELSDVIDLVVEALAEGKIVAWFRGRLEFGPRALGHRSIFADPRRADLKERLNAQVKHREPFRPFAPVVLEEDREQYFTLPACSPTMMLVAPVRAEWRARLPTITHVDGSARVQTVSRATDPEFHLLLERWRECSGTSVLLNTSFNENEPIVRTPAEALATARRAGIDVLILERTFLRLKTRDVIDRVAPSVEETPRSSRRYMPLYRQVS